MAQTAMKLQLYLLHKECSNKNYKFRSAAHLTARRLSRIFAKALLVLIGRLVADEVGNTWLEKRQHIHQEINPELI